jgi:KipI family sensor histidine kinase inhibitor
MIAVPLPYGPRAVLIECAPAAVRPVADALAGVEGVWSVVPAAATVLVEHDGRPGVDRLLADTLDALAIGAATTPDGGGAVVEIAVRYDGEDLAAVADLCGLSTAEVIELHTGCVFTSAFCGFAPGFAYLTGLPEPLVTVPRRSTPRTRVPAGAVAIAGGYSAVYPSTSPGGWQVIGRSDAVLWDAASPTPALLAPGTRVRFREVRP